MIFYFFSLQRVESSSCDFFLFSQFAEAPNASTRYSTELERQAEERKLRTMLEGHRDRNEAKKHFDAFDKRFGSHVPDNLKKVCLNR